MSATLMLTASAQAGWVYESATEWVTSGDFDGDGRQDLVVVDRENGNLRAGYQTSAGALVWSASRSSGVDHPTGVTSGRFIALTRDALAVTSPDANRIHLISLASTTAPLTPLQRYPIGLGPSTLAALSAPFGFFPGSYDFLAVTSAEESGLAGQRLDLMATQAGELSLGHSVEIPAAFERLNGFQFSPTSGTFLGGLQRLQNRNDFYLFQFTNTLLEPFVFSGLPAGTDWLFGRFSAGNRFLFYQPGTVSGLEIHTADPTSPQVLVTPGTALTPFGSTVDTIQLISRGNTNLLLVLQEDGQSARIYDLAPGNRLIESQSFVVPAGERFTTAVPMSAGQFALLTSRTGERASTGFHFYRYGTGGFAETASGNLPAARSGAGRATVLLFDQEPFVSREPGFVGALAGGDWVTRISNLPSSITVESETDRGTSLGLGTPSTRSLGVAPASARFGLANQYHPAISFSSLKSASGLEPGSVTILPPPGRYSGPVSVTLRSTTPGDTLYLRRGLQLPWELYSGPVTLSNTTEVAFYSENSSTSTRSRLQSATYEFPVQAQPFTPAAGSNLPPIAVAGSVQRLLIARSTQVFLDGTRSRDPEGGPLSYQWQQLKGPPLILIGGDTASPSFFTPAFTNTLVLQFRLIVYDDHQVSSVSETAVVLDDGCVKPPYVPPTSGFGEDGSFNGALRWPGLPEQEVQIQASIDLENWTDLGIGTSDLLGWVVFTDLAAGTYSQRFYRAILR